MFYFKITHGDLVIFKTNICKLKSNSANMKIMKIILI